MSTDQITIELPDTNKGTEKMGTSDSNILPSNSQLRRIADISNSCNSRSISNHQAHISDSDIVIEYERDETFQKFIDNYEKQYGSDDVLLHPVRNAFSQNFHVVDRDLSVTEAIKHFETCDMLFVLPDSKSITTNSQPSSRSSSAIQSPVTPSSRSVNITINSIQNSEYRDEFSDPKAICSNDITNQIITKGELWNQKTIGDIADCVSTHFIVYPNTPLLECLHVIEQYEEDHQFVLVDECGICGFITLDNIFHYVSNYLNRKKADGRVISKLDQKLQAISSSIYVHLFICLLCIADFVLVFINNVPPIIGLVIAVIYILELVLRMKVQKKKFFKLTWNIVDVILLLYTATLAILLTTAFPDDKTFGTIYQVGLIFRFIRGIIRACYSVKKMVKYSKKLVSQNKRRMVTGEYDLDLTYITTRCIAMSLPSENLESIYRNNIKEVAKYLDEHHGKNYMVYNLCAEKKYDEEYFHGFVNTSYPIKDHNVPPLEKMHQFAIDVENYLNQSPQNIIAVHCKGGKGRTGCMICAYLVRSGTCVNADEALRLFRDKRTGSAGKDQGVTGPSQIRYVHYYEQALLYRQMPSASTLDLNRRMVAPKQIIISNLPKISTSLLFTIEDENGNETASELIKKIHDPIITLNFHILLKNDFRFTAKTPSGYEYFYCWLHSFFVEKQVILKKEEIDGACKNAKYPENFEIAFLFEIFNENRLSSSDDLNKTANNSEIHLLQNGIRSINSSNKNLIQSSYQLSCSTNVGNLTSKHIRKTSSVTGTIGRRKSSLDESMINRSKINNAVTANMIELGEDKIDEDLDENKRESVRRVSNPSNENEDM